MISGPTEVGCGSFSLHGSAPGKVASVQWLLDGQDLYYQLLTLSLPVSSMSVGMHTVELLVTVSDDPSTYRVGHDIERIDTPGPELTLSGPSSASLSEAVEITALLVLNPCSSLLLAPVTTITSSAWAWSVDGKPVTTNAQRSQLQLQNSLSPGPHAVCATVTLTTSLDPQEPVITASACHALVSTFSPVVATILGPATRLLALGGAQADPYDGATLLLNASTSHDPDMPSTTAAEDHLSFVWHCEPMPACETQWNPVDSDTSVVQLAVDASAPLGKWVFTVTVSSNWTTDGYAAMRSASSSVLVHVIEGGLSISLSAPEYITTNDVLRILATSSQSPFPSSDIALSWNETTTGLSLADSLTPPSSASLVLPAGVLEAGRAYEFRLSARERSSGVTVAVSAVVEVRTNPQPGSCHVEGETEHEQLAPFTVVCHNWTSASHTALHYSFGVITPASSGETESGHTVLAGPQFLPRGSLFIPLTADPQTLFVIVGDDHGASSFYAVAPPVVSLVDDPLREQCNVTRQALVLVQHATALQDSSDLVGLVRMIILYVVSDRGIGDTICGIDADALWGLLLDALGQLIEEAEHTELSDQDAAVLVDVLLILLRAAANDLSYQSITRLLELTDLVLLRVLAASPAVTESILWMLSSLLTRENCESLPLITSLLTLLSHRAVSNTLPTELLAEFDHPNLRQWQGRVPTEADLLYPGVTVPSEALQTTQGGDFADVTIARYGDTLRACYPRTVGEIITITLSEDGEETGVNNLNEPVRFELTLDTEAVSALNARPKMGRRACIDKSPLCVWWDESANEWSPEGCRSEGLVLQGNDTLVRCACQHLTDFSLLLKAVEEEGTIQDLHVCDPEKGVVVTYSFLASAYFMLLAVCTFKVVHFIYFQKIRFKPEALLLQHAVIVLTALFRGINCLRIADFFQTSLGVSAVLLALPYCCVFWVFTLLVFQWAAVFHYSMSAGTSAFHKVRPIFIACNVIMAFTVVCLMLMLGLRLGPAWPLAVAGSAITATITLSCAIGFCVYAQFLSSALANNSLARSSAQSAPASGCCNSVAGRLRLLGWVVPVCFGLEAILWVVSMLLDGLPGKFVVDVAFLLLDIVALWAVVLVFHKALVSHANKSPRSLACCVLQMKRQDHLELTTPEDDVITK